MVYSFRIHVAVALLLCVYTSRYSVAQSNDEPLNVELTVTESAGIDRVDEPVTTGVCFARGAVVDLDELVVRDADGATLPSQFRSLAKWPDDSVRWALMDTRVTVDANASVALTIGAVQRPVVADAITVSDDAESIEVTSGSFKLTVSKSSGSLIDRLTVGGVDVIIPGSPGPTVVSGGERHRLKIDSVSVEEGGDLRTVLLVRGTYTGVHQGMLHATARLTVWAGKPRVGIRLFFENAGRFGYTGRPEWFQFDSQDFALDLNLGKLESLSLDGNAIDLGDAVDFRVRQMNTTRLSDGFRFDATEGGAEVASGERSNGVVTLRGKRAAATVAVRHFWENYDKAIAVEGQRLRIELWPGDGSWPPVKGTWSGRGAGDFKQYRVQGSYHLQGGVRKGHELVLDFSRSDPASTRAIVASPLMALASPEHYVKTEALPGVFAPVGDSTKVVREDAYDRAVEVWNRTAFDMIDRESETSIFSARDGERGKRVGAGSWYGWMDFGDHPWGGGMSSLHYDWTWIALLNYLRLQKGDYGELGVQMARHLMEVDHTWSDRDEDMLRHLPRYEFNNGYLHGGVGDGYCKANPSHMWATGLVTYYFLTGDPMAKECALSLGDGVRTRLVERLRRQPTANGQSRASSWSILVCCALYDMTADEAWIDDALVLFRNHLRVKWKSKGGPYYDNGLQYYYGCQALVELHRRCGDEELFELIEAGARGDFPEDGYGEWKVWLADTTGYVGGVLNDEELIDKAMGLFAGYSQSKVFNGNQAWDKESGKYLRSGHILSHTLWQRSQKE